MLIMFFYGTFAFEFGDMSGDTLLVLSGGGRCTELHLSEEGRGGQPSPDTEGNVRLGEEAKESKGWKLHTAMKLFHSAVTKN